MAGNYQDVQKCCCCLKKEFFLRQKGQIGDKFRGHFTERVLHWRKSEYKPDPNLNSFRLEVIFWPEQSLQVNTQWSAGGLSFFTERVSVFPNWLNPP